MKQGVGDESSSHHAPVEYKSHSKDPAALQHFHGKKKKTQPFATESNRISVKDHYRIHGCEHAESLFTSSVGLLFGIEPNMELQL